MLMVLLLRQSYHKNVLIDNMYHMATLCKQRFVNLFFNVVRLSSFAAIFQENLQTLFL